MSIVDPRLRGRVGSMRGFTAIEVMVALVLIAGMALVVQQTLSATHSSAQYMRAVQTATERSHNLAYEVREQVTSSRRMFFNDIIGRAYMDAVDLSTLPPVPWSRLPLIDEGGRLEPDPVDEPMTGNCLLFVGETDSISVVADVETNQVKHIDAYRFHAIYVHETDRMVVVQADGENALDLVSWQSVEFPNYQQLRAIEDDAQRATVVATLVNRYGLTYAWDPGGRVDDSFYLMNGSGALGVVPVPDIKIEEHGTESRGGRLVYAHTQLARTNPLDGRRRSLFTRDDPNVWQPHGFEVKIVGRSGSRQVWMHLVAEVQASTGGTAAHASTLIMSTKDL